VTRLKHSERSLTESNRRLTVLATTDELTGLPNRRMLSEQLSLALARARRGGLAVALLSVDLDGFKSVNDSLGHAYGDQLLVEVARLLRAGARDTDVVARNGGDEFLVVLADLDVEDASSTVATVVERIERLLSSPVLVGPVELRADASIGVAIYPLDAREEDDLLRAADEAMYRRKQAAITVA
jgi:diguanylate cyclase